MRAVARRAQPSTSTDERLLDFIARVSPRFRRPEHLGAIIAQLEACDRASVRAVFNAPPRHGKTETLLHFIAWYLSRHPDRTVGYATYSSELALSKSRLARDYARRCGVMIRQDSDSMHEWRTAQGGGCLAAGAGGWTGQGVHVLLIDDPYADRQAAESPIVRKRVVEWFQSVANSRIEPGGSICVSHTRWHESDLSGYILREAEDRDEYIETNLPAINAAGEALWPERWPLEDLLRKQRGVGPYEWSALYLGHPIPKGGEVFRAPATYERLDLTDRRIVIGCDPAGSANAKADHTAAVVLAVKGYGVDATADVVEVVRIQGETGAVAAELLALCRKHGAALTIEATRDGKAITRALQTSNQHLRVNETPAYASKFIRAQPVASAWNEGRVRVPAGQPVWKLDEFVYEVSKFTGVNDRHDDQVDALAYAWNAGAAVGESYAVESQSWDR